MTDPRPAGSITVSIADGVASISIDNPSQRNSLTRSMCLELQRLMPLLEADPNVIVVTLRGVSPSFSAGVSITELSSVLLDEQEDGTRIDHLSRADEAIASASKPTVALVDGACMGGGWQIASACDFIVASERSVFAITPAKLGVIYPRSGIERLVRQVGDSRAKYILFTGDTFSAVRAQALGLVAEVISDEEFEARSASLVVSLLNNSQFSVRTLKCLVDLPISDRRRPEDSWIAAWADMADGPDMEIGTKAFLNRERPRFTWGHSDR